MSTIRVIPCLDCKNGRVVKGVQFQQLTDSGDPAALAALYQEQGADEIVVLDIAATLEERQNALHTVRAVRRELSIPLTVGGGVRTLNDAVALLNAGADKIGVNSAAVEQPTLMSDIANRYGKQCVVLAIDAKKNQMGWQVMLRGGTYASGLDVLTWAKQAEEYGVGEILLTSFDQDGTRAGYDLELMRAMVQVVQVPVIASGGAAHPQHCIEAVEAGASAVLAASIFHQGLYSVGDVKHAMSQKGIWVRP